MYRELCTTKSDSSLAFGKIGSLDPQIEVNFNVCAAHMCVCIFTCVCLYACGGQRLSLGCLSFPLLSSTLYAEAQTLSLELRAHSSAGLASHLAQDFLFLSPMGWNYWSVTMPS